MSGAHIPIIVTRAEPGAQETVERLQTRGLNAVSAPMLTLRELPDTDLPPVSDLSGLVFTSANGVRAYARRETDRALPTWCVGPATAAMARTSGFNDVRESSGNAKDLADYIAAHSTPAEDPLLHVANAAAAGHLRQDLVARGYHVRFAPFYEMQPAQTLPDPVTRLLQARTPSILLVHSAKGASAAVPLIGTLPDTWCVVAISDQAAAPLGALGSGRTYLAKVPNEEGLMTALDAALATLSA